MTLIKRLTLIISNVLVEHIFYPVFPPHKNADEVIDWFTKSPENAVKEFYEFRGRLRVRSIAL